MSLLSVPLKIVLMYHADVQDESIPAGYEICDGRLLNASQQDINPGGTYQLPNLINRYPIGADITKAAFNTGDYTVSSAAGAPGPKGAMGSNVKTLSIAEMPPHNHHVGDGNDPAYNTGYAGAAGHNGVGDAFTTTVGGGSSFDLRPRSYGLVFIMKVKL